jgi:hypothetical protein
MLFAIRMFRARQLPVLRRRANGRSRRTHGETETVVLI